MNLSKREINAGKAIFSFYSFKNLLVSEFGELAESTAGQTFDDQAVIIKSVIWGDASFIKNWKKAFDLTFDEPNWPSIWIDRSGIKKEITGYFVAIGGSTVKTLLSDDFVSKTFDSAFGKIMVGGNFNTGNSLVLDSQMKALTDNLSKALLFSGMSTENIIDTTLVSPDDAIKSKYKYPINLNLLSPAQKSIQACITAIEPINLKVENQSDDGLFQFIEIQDNNHALIQTVSKYNLASDEQFTGMLENYFSELEKHLVQKSIEWENLFSAIIFSSGEEITKQLKVQMKEKKIPLSAVVIIEHQLSGVEKGFVAQMNFIKY